MNFLLEFTLLGCILYLSYIIYRLKQKNNNADSLEKENQYLKGQAQYADALSKQNEQLRNHAQYAHSLSQQNEQLRNQLVSTQSLNNENHILKNQLTQKENEFKSREETFNNLRITFEKEQKFLSQRKLELDTREKHLTDKLAELQTKLDQETEARKKVVSQKKSSEVRLGHIAETLAPFLDQFEFEPENCSFLGKPIDYISFGDDEITFIEVKSGKSQLNQKQRHIRDLVKAKLVNWKEIRIK